MKTLCLLLVGVVVGWAASGVDWSREAVGQEQGTSLNADAMVPAPSTSLYGQPNNVPATPPQLRGHTTGLPLIGRFQVSAYGSPNGHGCYVVDTTTGQTWHVANGQPPEIVVGPLYDALLSPSRSQVQPDRVPPPSTVAKPFEQNYEEWPVANPRNEPKPNTGDQ